MQYHFFYTVTKNTIYMHLTYYVKTRLKHKWASIHINYSYFVHDAILCKLYKRMKMVMKDISIGRYTAGVFVEYLYEITWQNISYRF